MLPPFVCFLVFSINTLIYENLLHRMKRSFQEYKTEHEDVPDGRWSSKRALLSGNHTHNTIIPSMAEFYADYIIDFSDKYNGQSLRDTCKRDPEWASYVLRSGVVHETVQDLISHFLSEVIPYVQRKDDFLIAFGEYKGFYVSELANSFVGRNFLLQLLHAYQFITPEQKKIVNFHLERGDIDPQHITSLQLNATNYCTSPEQDGGRIGLGPYQQHEMQYEDVLME